MMPGIVGVRQLARAFAEVHLRRRVPPLVASPKWGNRKGRPWSGEEHERALAMREVGYDNELIGWRLNRSKQSVNARIGYQKKRAA